MVARRRRRSQPTACRRVHMWRKLLACAVTRASEPPRATEVCMKRRAGYLLLLCLLAPAFSARAAESSSAGEGIERYKKNIGGQAIQRAKKTPADGGIKNNKCGGGRLPLSTPSPGGLGIDHQTR